MKKLLIVLAITLSLNTSAQEKKKQLKNTMVEASCGQCQFATKDKDCFLAIRYDNKVYSVVGTTIDDHGDAHAQDGFCNAVRKAKVSGTLKNGKFLVKTFTVIN